MDDRVPETVVDATIAHELCHYAHGFASPLPRFSKFPHKGDIVDTELIRRGLKDQLEFQDKWLKQSWNSLVGERIFCGDHKKRRPHRKKAVTFGNLVNFLSNFNILSRD